MPPKAKKSKRIEERTMQNLILDQTSVQSLVQSISGLKKQVGDLQSRMDSQEQSPFPICDLILVSLFCLLSE